MSRVSLKKSTKAAVGEKKVRKAAGKVFCVLGEQELGTIQFKSLKSYSPNGVNFVFSDVAAKIKFEETPVNKVLNGEKYKRKNTLLMPLEEDMVAAVRTIEQHYREFMMAELEKVSEEANTVTFHSCLTEQNELKLSPNKPIHVFDYRAPVDDSSQPPLVEWNEIAEGDSINAIAICYGGWYVNNSIGITFRPVSAAVYATKVIEDTKETDDLFEHLST